MTAMSRRWLTSWCSSSTCWVRSCSRRSALTSACAAAPAKMLSVVSSSGPNRSLPSREATTIPRTRPSYDHRHDEHRLRAVRLADDQAARVRVGVADQQRLAVLRDPAGQALADPDPEQLRLGIDAAHERALEGDRLAPARVVVDAVDADRVVGDRASAPRRRSSRRSRARPGCWTGGPTGPGSARRRAARSSTDAMSRALPIAVAIVSPKLRRQRDLVRRPVVRLGVVQDEQRERLAAEDGRHEAQRLDAVLRVQLAHLGRDRGVVGVAEDEDLLAAQRLEAGELRVRASRRLTRAARSPRGSRGSPTSSSGCSLLRRATATARRDPRGTGASELSRTSSNTGWSASEPDSSEARRRSASVPPDDAEMPATAAAAAARSAGRSRCRSDRGGASRSTATEPSSRARGRGGRTADRPARTTTRTVAGCTPASRAASDSVISSAAGPGRAARAIGLGALPVGTGTVPLWCGHAPARPAPYVAHGYAAR